MTPVGSHRAPGRRPAPGGPTEIPDRAPPGHAASLRSRFGADARRLGARPPIRHAIGAIALHIGSAIAVALAVDQLRGWSPGWGIAALPLAWFFIGSRFRALGNMMHECSHRMLTRRAALDDRLGHFLSFFDFTDFHAYRLEHRSHHRHLGHPTLDLDYVPRRRLFERMGPFGARHILLPLSLFHLPLYVRPVLWSRRDTRRMAAARCAFNLGLLAAGQFAIGWEALLLYYVTPYLGTYQIMRFWSDAADHAGLMTEPTEFDRARNHCLRFAALNWLLLPRNDQYHLVHHLFPTVPISGLPALHALLMQADEYRARSHGLDVSR
jgi:fatty acid desaturase